MHNLTFPFSLGIFFPKNNMTVITHPPDLPDLASCDFSLFPRLMIKLKGYHFDTTEVIKAESQAMFNALTEHNFLDAFKKLQKRWE
jgi:hypothetical protein